MRVGGWGGVGLLRISQTFQEVFKFLFPRTEAAALLFTALDSLLRKPCGCCSYSTACSMCKIYILLIYIQIGNACMISCWEWSPTSKAMIRRKWFNSSSLPWQFMISSPPPLVSLVIFFMKDTERKEEGRNECAREMKQRKYLWIWGCVFSQERPGEHLVLEIGPHVLTTVHKHGCWQDTDAHLTHRLLQHPKQRVEGVSVY